ncbi:m153R [Myxoma virus]|uniref:E3 ubiquitin-protein ligase LAP n=1 Tax=Myxoma virus TaxID=10273 RepID=A0A481ND25_9POXV|nr:m153R [Myxoma virus]
MATVVNMDTVVNLDDVSLADKCCWICKEACDIVPNYCKCRGDNKIVHKECLEEWINTDVVKNKSCAICESPYNLKRWYKKITKWRCYKRDCHDSLLVNMSLCLIVGGMGGYLLISTEIVKLIASEEVSNIAKVFLVSASMGPFMVSALTMVRACIDCRTYFIATRERNTIHEVAEMEDVEEVEEVNDDDGDEYVDAVEEIVVESPA